MPLPKPPMARHLLLLLPLAAGGCAARERTSLAIPPAADLRAAIEPKPRPDAIILTSARAEADYTASVEAWGERVSAAAVRLCRWTVAAGAKLPFECR